MRLFCCLLICGLLAPSFARAEYVCPEEFQRGVATWYGPGFHGALTKSEEVFDSTKFSAAHQNLPFGTVLKVTNLRNYKSVFVRVNDRGAFNSSIIDLSEAAARQIDMIDAGTTAVALYQCR